MMPDNRILLASGDGDGREMRQQAPHVAAVNLSRTTVISPLSNRSAIFG